MSHEHNYARPDVPFRGLCLGIYQQAYDSHLPSNSGFFLTTYLDKDGRPALTSMGLALNIVTKAASCPRNRRVQASSAIFQDPRHANKVARENLFRVECSGDDTAKPCVLDRFTDWNSTS